MSVVAIKDLQDKLKQSEQDPDKRMALEKQLFAIDSPDGTSAKIGNKDAFLGTDEVLAYLKENGSGVSTELKSFLDQAGLTAGVEKGAVSLEEIAKSLDTIKQASPSSLQGTTKEELLSTLKKIDNQHYTTGRVGTSDGGLSHTEVAAFLKEQKLTEIRKQLEAVLEANGLLTPPTQQETKQPSKQPKKTPVKEPVQPITPQTQSEEGKTPLKQGTPFNTEPFISEASGIDPNNTQAIIAMLKNGELPPLRNQQDVKIALDNLYSNSKK